MKAYSLDLRERIVAAYEGGEGTQKELAELFGVSLSWFESLLHRWRETGSVLPKPHGGGRQAKVTGKSLERLKTLVKETPDATLEELRRKCRTQGSIMSVFRALQRLGITRKKSRSST
jgi:transposase